MLNLRDLGGLPAEGGAVRAGVLLRGGHLHGLRARDVAELRDGRRVRLVVDLRTDAERAEKPDAAIPGAEVRHVPLFGEAAVGITRERESLRTVRGSLADRLPDMEALYREMVGGACLGQLTEAVRAIVDFAVAGPDGPDGRPNGAVLFHCTEGKDRTGIVSLVLLSLLGVPRDAIMADYLRTNETAGKRAARYYRLARLLTRDRATAEKMRRVFLADETYLSAAIAAIERDWGTFESFAADGLGIPEPLQQEFLQRMAV